MWDVQVSVGARRMVSGVLWGKGDGLMREKKVGNNSQKIEYNLRYISEQNTIPGEAQGLIEWMPGDGVWDRVCSYDQYQSYS